MRKRRYDKNITMIVLIIGVFSFSIAFAAFSSTLIIRSSTTVSPSKNNFSVKFSKSRSSLDEGEIVPTSENQIVAENSSKAMIDNSKENPTVSNISAAFTAPGQDVKYAFFALNTGSLKAYYRGVGFKNVPGTDYTKKCTALEGATESLVQSACNNISMRFQYGGSMMTVPSTARDPNYTNSGTNYLDPYDPMNNYDVIYLTIVYSSNAIAADGPFTVEFGDIYLNFSSTAN